jgi:hypothetical protein
MKINLMQRQNLLGMISETFRKRRKKIQAKEKKRKDSNISPSQI